MPQVNRIVAFLLVVVLVGGCGAQQMNTETLLEFANADLVDNPDDPTALVARAKVYLKMQSWKEALEDYNHAERFGEFNQELFIHRGIAYARLKKYDEAMKDLDRAVKMDPTKPEPYIHRAFVNYKKNELAKAMLDLDLAHRQDPDNPLLCLYQARVLVAEGQQGFALEWFDNAIRMKPNWGDPYYYRALLYRTMGKSEIAERDMKTATDLGFYEDNWECPL